MNKMMKVNSNQFPDPCDRFANMCATCLKVMGRQPSMWYLGLRRKAWGPWPPGRRRTGIVLTSSSSPLLTTSTGGPSQPHASLQHWWQIQRAHNSDCHGLAISWLSELSCLVRKASWNDRCTLGCLSSLEHTLSYGERTITGTA